MHESDAVLATGSAPLEQPTAGASPAEMPMGHAEEGLEEPVTSNGEAQSGFRQQRTVPYGALAEERARRKELQRGLQSAIEVQQRLQGRLDLLHELAQQQAGPGSGETGDAMPASADPQQEAAPELPSAAEVEAQALAHAQAEEGFRTQVMHSVREAMHERPDFLAAYQHARQSRVAELCALGYAPDEAMEITFDNELEVIRNAYENGRNPALVIYDYAQRHGYRGATSRAVPDDAPKTAPRPPAMSEAQKVALAARGQAASKSLSTAGGGATGTLTLEALASMSDEEFAEATKGERWRKLLN